MILAICLLSVLCLIQMALNVLIVSLFLGQMSQPRIEAITPDDRAFYDFVAYNPEEFN